MSSPNIQATSSTVPANDGKQLILFTSSCFVGAVVLIFSVSSDAVGTYDGGTLHTEVQRQEYQLACMSGTLPGPILAGMALLSTAFGLSVVGTVTFLALSCCGCSLCCLPRKCCDPIGQASTSLALSVIFLFFSLPLFAWNISWVATSLRDCRETRIDSCFTELDFHPYYCSMRLVRAGIGSMAGLSGCIALILAGNFAYLGPAIRTRAAHIAAALSVAAASAPLSAVHVVRSEHAAPPAGAYVDPPIAVAAVVDS
jgi:hypothetical protein